MLRVMLASESPRRRELLTMIGIAHEVRPARIDETHPPGEPPAALTERLAREKAAAIVCGNGDGVSAGDPDIVVIAADTIVLIDGRVLGKPTDSADAAGMLRELSGRTHTVYTGVAVSRGPTMVSGVERVQMTFRDLSDSEIAGYIATGEPKDKAGAYGIQGYGATIVERIEGDYFAVMGLALNRLITLLARVGVRYEFRMLRDDGLPAA